MSGAGCGERVVWVELTAEVLARLEQGIWVGDENVYAERGSPKYEKAALHWLERYFAE